MKTAWHTVKIACKTIAYSLVFLMLILVIVFCTPVGPMLSVAFEDVLVKWELDNPHIDRNYAGWKEVTLAQCDPFMLPEKWTVEEVDGVYSVITGSGDLWAIGAVFGGAEDRFGTTTVFAAEVLKLPEAKMTADPVHEFGNIRGSSIYKLHVSGAGIETSYYYIKLIKASGVNASLILFPDLKKNNGDFEIAEAIMFSFAY